ncbi:MAG: 2-C-methyl-D-erythritol 4-phosphate cytidylyltransferase [Deltaproteobacteria bacterium]|nr:2-C-methyl-D-erythritol 4-phosphate cytidylyltransferase [Deltaproteobacteria bacterium]
MFAPMRVALLIPAAGSGSRLGYREPKALVDVGGASLLRRTLERLAVAATFVETVVLVPAGAVSACEAAVAEPPAALGRCVVRVGGATRQESVRRGLIALSSDAEIVCVHDAARPLAAAVTVREVLSRAQRSGAATAAARPTDSVRIEEGEATRALDRGCLWLVETPQAFRRELLERAHREAERDRISATDDASLVEGLGQRIEVVESAGPNFKVTVEADLVLVREMLAREARAARR